MIALSLPVRWCERLRLRAACVVIGMLCLGAGRTPAQDVRGRELVIVPTLGTDHQFNLDYTVAHLAALLDSLAPDVLVIEDYDDWLAGQCLWFTTAPESHVALRYAISAGIPIVGTFRRAPADGLERARRTEEEYRNATREDASEAFRPRLDATTATIARDYSFAAGPRTLRALMNGGFEEMRASWPPVRRNRVDARAAQLADSLRARMAADSAGSRWVVLSWWGFALPIADSLAARSDVRVLDLATFLPIDSALVAHYMNFANVSWILSGLLDEWHGMWAPQAFPGARITALLQQLEARHPDEPVTRFLRARWAMQYRDYERAEALLRPLAAEADSSRFPFPLNGKWIRPPWRSVARKAKLNLALIHDYRGEREQALALYHELLQLGDDLNRDAAAVGYVHDDIERVVRSYFERPYSGMPDEAFRHFPLTARVPECAPRTIP